MQTILGSGGAIGKELALCLTAYSKDFRLVSRNPQKINPGDELIKADLTVAEQVNKAVKGSDVVYLVAGLPYSIKSWEAQWPVVMSNVIDACKVYNSKLVFFDNIYMLNPVSMGNMTEDSPVGPVSRKGKVRAQIAQMIIDEINAGNLKAIIARSADFYGPEIQNSVLLEAVYKNLKAGKKANWFCSLSFKHSFTFTPDAALATAMLGNSEDAWNQVWHLPTAPEPLTGEEWIKAFAAQLDEDPKSLVAGKTIVKIMGLFNPVMKEFVEMLYQYDRDYIFNSSKFEKHFNFKPTPYLEGIKRIIEADAISYIKTH
ncbi:MAG: NAD-dependent epimerase/dehydratase family protein [Prolixibacteraceae bacterium]|nr:NAD-dependent epimerase/dehydratase family protein [Prolixibacteraceae bacterium]MBN2774496.1 NAD-dependent epimerase/dehydratase family protein [Prolixibacteraceae bacterium]